MRIGILTILAALVVSRAVAPVHAADASTGADFWSFQPIVKPAVPPVADSKWGRNPIDAFILAKLESAKLTPAPEASKDVLIRRVTFDLTGLPPTPEEVRAFRADKSSDAYEKLVDRLLASPHYGERWGRHWLDVARYVPGRINFPGVKNSRGDQAYRDYVVRAFNADKPYDRFITEQLAGDLLPPTADRQQYFDQITAPAFLSIGAWFDMETDPNRLRLEMVDEQINTATKAFLGLTVACARCHDHKTDPIPTADYYALGGIFRSTRLVGDFSEFWRDGRVRQLRPLAMPDEVAANDAIRAQIDAKKAAQWKMLTDEHARLSARWRADEARYREVAAKLPKSFVKLFEAEQFAGQDNLRIAELMRDGKVVQVLETQTPGAQWLRYKFEVPETGKYRLDVLHSTDEGAPLYLQVNGTTVTGNALNKPTGGWDLRYQRWDTIATFELRKGVNFLRMGIANGSFPRLDRFRLYSQNEATEAQIAQAAGENDLDAKVLASVARDPAQPWPTVAGMMDFLDEPALRAWANLQNEATGLAEGIQPYPQVIAVTDLPSPVELPVHVRGETYSTPGQPVARGALSVLNGRLPPPSISQGSSGRLELAKWLTDPRNPLPARVMANRIWQGHFDRGIVASASDFGTTGDRPTHPELLDWLATDFVENGWSIKHLHRLILTSSVYRMDSAKRTHGGSADTDPANTLLSHFPPRRLEAEAIYDAMRSTTNMIPRQESGQPLDYDKSAQRAMYILTNGRSPQGLGGEVRKFFTLFDYDTSSAMPLATRQTSQTAAQSLFWMNSPLVKFLAGKFAERLLKMDRLDDAKRVEMAYLLALGREPGDSIKQQALAFIEQATRDEGMTREEAWTQLCQSLYATAEFRYVQ